MGRNKPEQHETHEEIGRYYETPIFVVVPLAVDGIPVLLVIPHSIVYQLLPRAIRQEFLHSSSRGLLQVTYLLLLLLRAIRT
jgi:hypothetical protein